MSTAPRYLGLDIATCTGYALAEGNKIIQSGVRDFSAQNIGSTGIKFYNWLNTLGRVDEIYYEKIQFGGGFKNKKTGQWVSLTNDGREKYHGLLMVMNMYAAGYGIPTIGIYPVTLKKAFTDYGHADKEDMCTAAHAIGWKGGAPGTALCHDEADAIGLVYTQLRDRHGLLSSF